MGAHSVTPLFIQLVHSQYVDIWYDDMNANNGWELSNDVILPQSSAYCFNGDCAKIMAYNGNSWIENSTNIAAYSHIQLQFDLYAFALESNDFCQVWYRYDSDSWAQFGGDFPDGSYDNEILTFPAPSPTTTNIDIALLIEGDSTKSSDICYFDNVYLRGIVRTLNPTETPSYSPSDPPSNSPSNPPTTYSPTKPPTAIPTAFPTSKNPSYHPTKTPTDSTDSPSFRTLFPTMSPTKNPTIYPTHSPTMKPTNSPTTEPTKDPTGSESEIKATTSTALETRINNDDFSGNERSDFYDTLIMIFVFLLCCLCCFLGFVLLAYWRNKRYAKELYNLESDTGQVLGAGTDIPIQEGVVGRVVSVSPVSSLDKSYETELPPAPTVVMTQGVDDNTAIHDGDIHDDVDDSLESTDSDIYRDKMHQQTETEHITTTK